VFHLKKETSDIFSNPFFRRVGSLSLLSLLSFLFYFLSEGAPRDRSGVVPAVGHGLLFASAASHYVSRRRVDFVKE
jgi:hypothetical protein